ncbi:alpha/beta fold hydrolase [Acrocarpospora catenulata]|uniref:alpha/beta fold hydrolase n=1 Tax=Acrocarpospora catenulata TaxID=2836182 RepID=UPI001BDB65FC|nr:alpha/beta hydrolase [Acrocarpospora catenulata]
MTEVVKAAEDRLLSYEERGVPTGDPVFLLHGTPGSRLGPRPRSGLLYRLGVRLITYDRPGYGQSDSHIGRRVADCAEDVQVIADTLGLKKFAVVGRSGGGPHALACAALLGDRVTRAAALVSLAPRDAEGLEWFAGMTESNIAEYTAALQGRTHLIERLRATADEIKANPVRLIASLYSELPKPDRRVVSDTGIRRMLEENYAEALRRSADGWADDAVAFARPWGFDPADITVPVLLWHGAEDVFSPISHSLWLADRIPTASLTLKTGVAHFGALDALPKILPWLTGRSQSPRPVTGVYQG